jgi:F0F1-type ATP synthase membrane subunit a
MSFIYYNSSKENLKKLLHFLAQFLAKRGESISEITAQLISDIIATDNEKYFPIISVLFNFILFSNLVIPYSFTATSHLIITFTLSFSVLSE